MSGILHVKKGEGKKLLVIDHVIVEKIKAEDSEEAYGIAEIIVPVGGGAPLHQHSQQESFYVIEGNFTFKSIEDGKLKEVKTETGDFIHVPKNLPHSFVNSGDRTGRLLGLANPSGLEKFFDKIGKHYNGEEIKKRKPSIFEMVKIGFLAKRYGIKFFK